MQMNISIAWPKQQGFGVMKVFPWLAQNQSDWIYQQVDWMGIQDPIERLQKEQELYKQVLPIAKERAAAKERAEAKNEMYNKSLEEKDPVRKKEVTAQVRMADLTDLIKKKEWLSPDAPDEAIFNTFVKVNPWVNEKLDSYFKNWDETILIEMWLKEKPLAKKILDTAKDVWIWALAWAAWLGGLYAVGEGLKKVWKGTYWLTLPKSDYDADQIRNYNASRTKEKPVTAVDTMIESPWAQFVWTKTWIWDDATREKSRLSSEWYDPVYKKLDEAGTKADYRSLQWKAVRQAYETKWLSPTDKKAIATEIDEIFNENYKWDVSMRDLDLESSSVNRRLPKKYPEGGLASSTTKQAQMIISDVFRSFVKDAAKSIWEDLEWIHRDYGNLWPIEEMWDAARKKPTLSGWPLSWAGNVAQSASTVVTTGVWKAAYKLWKVASYLPEKIVQAGKNLGKGLLSIDPIWTPEILQYVPWTIGTSFKEYVETNPANVAFDAFIKTLEGKKEIKKHIKEVEKLKKLTPQEKEDMMNWKLIIL